MAVTTVKNILSLIADKWKMDGGVAFGVVPKSLWQKNWSVDENNMIDIVTRCLLIETVDRKILIDTGMGRKRDEKFYRYRFVDTKWSILHALKELNIEPEEISDIIFTHLHDDHVGGAIGCNEQGDLFEVFPKANYWCSETQLNWALDPNKREAASYFPDNLLPIKESGKLSFIHEGRKDFDGISFRMFDGHTIGQIIPIINYKGKNFVFLADFIPSVSHIPIPYIPSVDIQPLQSMKEKTEFLAEAVENEYILMFQHDIKECCTLLNGEKGIIADSVFTFNDYKLTQCQTTDC